MGTAHEETGHGYANRRTPQSSVKIGEAAGRRPAVAPRPASIEPAAGALPPRTHFDSQQWLNARRPSSLGKWMKRGGALAVTGMLGALAWVGYQQMPKGAAAAEKAEDTFVLTGETAGDADVPLSAPRMKPVQVADASEDFATSPFEQPTSFRRAPSVEPAVAQESPESSNPFAAFAKPAVPQAEQPAEPPFNVPTRLDVRQADAGVVTLASNETATPPEAAVEVFEVSGQREPAAIDIRAVQPAPVQPQQAAAESDPFAAFAGPAGPAEASSSVPAAFGASSPVEAAPVETQWTTAESSPTVTPAQFNSKPAPLPAAGGFEAEARPLNPAHPSGGDVTPGLSRQAAPADWPGFEPQPAVMEPGYAKPGSARPAYSPATERATPSGFNVPQPAAPANDPRDEKLHVVQQGETYWSIARQHYGAGRYFQALAEYNKPRISDQQPLKPGMKVLAPSAATLETRYGKLMQANGHAKPPAKPQSGLRVDAQGQPFYIVGEGDTLGEIATRCLGKTLRSDEIFRLNQEQLKNPNSLKAGMILVMPSDAFEVQSASSIPGRR